ncbi:Aste57867_18163 [Aphanomyces stellatus]|uniref:Copper transport protein n=1 Tax=Aphanomyces stellatus TaxID=120398 RepID=A0A485LAR5_9STRA|nr:hypothetical protein As57867_018101 [Aphanomyces stellatus]VFT94901.1 Aste57867_18163 [Aphanomyces stellatus]
MHSLLILGVLLATVGAILAHDHGSGNAAMPMGGGGKSCAICNMDVETDWYIELQHGQRIFSCSMTDGTHYTPSDVHSFSHAALTGATMKDISSNPKCDNSCPECDGGNVMDPISGAAVTSANFKFICLNRGQKVYFATDASKQSFAQGIASKPYFGVTQVICGGKPCPDGFHVPTLTSMAPPPAAAPFCTGASVMFSGFQTTVDGTCVKLFFQSWVLDTPLKYIVGLIGVFLLPLVNEYLVCLREDIRMAFIKTKLSRHQAWGKQSRKLLLTVLYMAQMTLAYFAMLVVMVYDTGLFLALISGFGVAFGYFKSERSLGLKSTAMMRATWRFDESEYLTVLSVDGMMCMQNCGSTVQTALEKVPGVKHVYVGFSEKCAYVSGSAASDALVQAVETIGFDARVLRRPRAESGPSTPYGSSSSHLA